MRVFVAWSDWFGDEREVPMEVDESMTFPDLLREIATETELNMDDWDLFFHKYHISKLDGYSDTQPLSWILATNSRLFLRPKPNVTQAAASSMSNIAENKHSALLGEVCMDPVPSFDVEDPKWKQYLDDHGYVVIRDVLSQEEVLHARDLFWEWLTATSEGACKRNEPRTWQHHHWPANRDTGIIDGFGVGQNRCSWFIRGAPKVKKAFAQLWGDDRLLTSFDGVAVFRPWLHDEDLKTKGGWYHVDQNSLMSDLKDKDVNGMCCVQGLVPLYPVDASTGGLTVIPDSHRQHSDICKRAAVPRSHFVPVGQRDPVLQMRAQLICTPPGALCLWDSRTVHCNSPGKPLSSLLPSSSASSSASSPSGSASAPSSTSGSQSVVCLSCGRVFASQTARLAHQKQAGHVHRLPSSASAETSAASAEISVSASAETASASSPPPPLFHAQAEKELLRVVCFVCMTPAKWAAPDVLTARRDCWKNHITTSHWPHLSHHRRTRHFVPHVEQLNAFQLALVDGR